jgi:hypothetical protein
MCGTMNESSSETCSFCGYIFEDQLAVNQARSVESSPSRNANSQMSLQKSATVTELPRNSQPTAATDERILRSQKYVTSKGPRPAAEGTLCLTTTRLLYVPDERSTETGSKSQQATTNRSLQDLGSDPRGTSIPLKSIVSVSGQRGFIRPSLVVNHHSPPDSPTRVRTEFVQTIKSRENGDVTNDINLWVPKIEQLMSPDSQEDLAEAVASRPVEEGELKSNILDVLGAISGWKGFFQLEMELDEKMSSSIDPDVIEKALKELVEEKAVEQDKYGQFFRKTSGGSKS